MDADRLLRAQRERIDAYDAAIVGLLGARMAVVRDVIAIKRAHAIPARLDDRVAAVLAKVRAAAERQACPPDLAEAVWRTVIEWTIAHEEQVLQPGSPHAAAGSS